MPSQPPDRCSSGLSATRASIPTRSAPNELRALVDQWTFVTSQLGVQCDADSD